MAKVSIERVTSVAESTGAQVDALGAVDDLFLSSRRTKKD